MDGGRRVVLLPHHHPIDSLLEAESWAGPRPFQTLVYPKNQWVGKAWMLIRLGQGITTICATKKGRNVSQAHHRVQGWALIFQSKKGKDFAASATPFVLCDGDGLTLSFPFPSHHGLDNFQKCYGISSCQDTQMPRARLPRNRGVPITYAKDVSAR